MSLPDVVSREQWLEARLRLLAEEKELTRRRDALNADRRRMPMVAVDKDYVFEGPAGPAGLLDMFDGCSQLVLQHIMFGPDWDAACSGCSAGLDEMAPALLRHLRSSATPRSPGSPAPRLPSSPHGRRAPAGNSPGTPRIATTSTMTST